jgi:hypothetical protein
MMRLLACVGLLLVAAHGFTVAPSRTTFFRVAPLSVAEMDDSTEAIGTDFEDAFDLLEASDDLDALLQEDSFPKESVAVLAREDQLTGASTEGDDADIVAQFLTMAADTRPGSMSEDEISLLRSVMQGLFVEEESSDSTEIAQNVENLLYRMLDEYDAARKSDDTKRMTLAEPFPEDFALVSHRMLFSLSCVI